MPNLLIFNKPFGVLSQFRDNDGHPGLCHYISHPGYYPAGRLDRDSEGLLLLTNDGRLQAHISSPKFKMPKTYWAQIEGEISPSQLGQLEAGVELRDGITRPATAREIPAPTLWERDPPVRFRKSVPTSWLELTITEGRNRQVRRMTAAVGAPTLRLVRVAIGEWRLNELAPGDFNLAETGVHRQNTRPFNPPRKGRHQRHAR